MSLCDRSLPPKPREFTPEEMEQAVIELLSPQGTNAGDLAAMLRHAARLQRERDSQQAKVKDQ